jgi:hypothetical protein
VLINIADNHNKVYIDSLPLPFMPETEPFFHVNPKQGYVVNYDENHAGIKVNTGVSCPLDQKDILANYLSFYPVSTASCSDCGSHYVNINHKPEEMDSNRLPLILGYAGDISEAPNVLALSFLEYVQGLLTPEVIREAAQAQVTEIIASMQQPNDTWKKYRVRDLGYEFTKKDEVITKDELVSLVETERIAILTTAHKAGFDLGDLVLETLNS